jgi:SAM-dependent methyltransferase
MVYDAGQQWTTTITSRTDMAYPSEYVIRIFKGAYPRLDLDKQSFSGSRICDVSCGDGRNLPLLRYCGFATYATEISQEIVDKVSRNLAASGVDAEVRVGTNDTLPFDDSFFDYVLSWNACYYMGQSRDFGVHVQELARILKSGGTLVLSVPKQSCFIYKTSDNEEPGFAVIRNDPYGVRNGEVLRVFAGEEELADAFSSHFKDFVFGSIHDDCFGFDYHWHIAVCRRR